jgi:hypothetical protein
MRDVFDGKMPEKNSINATIIKDLLVKHYRDLPEEKIWWKNKLYLNFSQLFSDLYENERPQTEDGKIFQGWGGGKYISFVKKNTDDRHND